MNAHGWKSRHANKHKRRILCHETLTIGPHRTCRGSPEKFIDHILDFCTIYVKGPSAKIKRCKLYGCIIIGDGYDLVLIGVKLRHCLFMNCNIRISKSKIERGNRLIASNTNIEFWMLTYYQGIHVHGWGCRLLIPDDGDWILDELGITEANLDA